MTLLFLARGSYVSKSCRTAVMDTFAMRPFWPLRFPLPADKRLTGPVRFGVDSTGERLAWVEASLPRLLFGHNGRLLASQADIDGALKALGEKLGEFAIVPPLADWPSPSRLDISWQFDIRQRLRKPAHALILAHQGLQHPAVKEPPVPRRNSLTWEGTKARLQFYGKSRKMKLGDDIMRVEYRLSGKPLRNALPGEDWRKLPNLWACFRTALSKLPAITAPSNSGGWPEAIGRSVPIKYHGPILAELANKSPRSRRDYSRRMSAASAHLGADFSWSEWLPPEGPPPPVHVEPKPNHR
jgi:hypothetical protein